MMDIKELRAKNEAELEKEILDLSRTRFELRMQKSAGQLTKTSEIKRIKTEIARAKTILAEKKRGSKQ